MFVYGAVGFGNGKKTSDVLCACLCIYLPISMHCFCCIAFYFVVAHHLFAIPFYSLRRKERKKKIIATMRRDRSIANIHRIYECLVMTVSKSVSFYFVVFGTKQMIWMKYVMNTWYQHHMSVHESFYFHLGYTYTYLTGLK